MKKAWDTGRNIILETNVALQGHGWEGLRYWPCVGEKVPAPRIADSNNWTITNIIVKKYKKVNSDLARLLFESDEFTVSKHWFDDDSEF